MEDKIVQLIKAFEKKQKINTVIGLIMGIVGGAFFFINRAENRNNREHDIYVQEKYAKNSTEQVKEMTYLLIGLEAENTKLINSFLEQKKEIKRLDSLLVAQNEAEIFCENIRRTVALFLVKNDSATKAELIKIINGLHTN
jgi:hypothetical protein